MLIGCFRLFRQIIQSNYEIVTVLHQMILGYLLRNNSKMNKTVRTAEPTIYSTSNNDEEINNAIDLARKNLHDFDSAFIIRSYDPGTIALKIKFPTNIGFEYIWAIQIRWEFGSYSGVIDNFPENAKDVKVGKRIKIDKDDITDWMFGRNGKLIGGYTLRAFRNRLTKHEKKNFDAHFFLKIDN